MFMFCATSRILTVMSKEVYFFSVSMTVDSYLRMRDIEGFCDNLPHQRNSLDWKILKRVLKNCGKEAEVKFSTVDGFW